MQVTTAIGLIATFGVAMSVSGIGSAIGASIDDSAATGSRTADIRGRDISGHDGARVHIDSQTHAGQSRDADATPNIASSAAAAQASAAEIDTGNGSLSCTSSGCVFSEPESKGSALKKSLSVTAAGAVAGYVASSLVTMGGPLGLLGAAAVFTGGLVASKYISGMSWKQTLATYGSGAVGGLLITKGVGFLASMQKVSGGMLAGFEFLANGAVALIGSGAALAGVAVPGVTNYIVSRRAGLTSQDKAARAFASTSVFSQSEKLNILQSSDGDLGARFAAAVRAGQQSKIFEFQTSLLQTGQLDAAGYVIKRAFANN